VPGVVTRRQVAQQPGHAESIDFFVYSMGYVHAEVVAAARGAEREQASRASAESS